MDIEIFNLQKILKNQKIIIMIKHILVLLLNNTTSEINEINKIKILRNKVNNS